MDSLCPTAQSGLGIAQPVFDTSTTPVVILEISALTPGDSPRTSVPDSEHALLLSAIEQPLPPIIVHRVGLRVIDGMHRVRAAMLRGDTTITAQLFDGTDDAAFLLAVRKNIAHGLPLSLAERKGAARRILAAHPQWSDRAIASCTGLSDKTIAAVRRSTSAEVPQSSVRLGVDGRARPSDGDQRRRLAAELIVAHPQAPLRQIAGAAGISLGTVRDVRARVSRGDDPVPARRRAAEPEPSAAIPTMIPEPMRPAGCGVRDPEQRKATLNRLRTDPSLRFSDAGRQALRWLHIRLAGPDQWGDLVDAIPLHWAEAVADLARGCAESWQEFAIACERRARRAG
jgi:ParB-like chromosome segregation protein Spo0J